MKKTGLFFALLILFSCSFQQEEKQDFRLLKTEFSNLNGFDKEDFVQLVMPLKKNCEALIENSACLEHSQIKISKEKYLEVCRSFLAELPQTEQSVKDFIMKNFEPYQVVSADGASKFTSYYEAEINASKIKHDGYIYPIYGRPNDIVEVNLKNFGDDLPAKTLFGRVEKGKLTPYYTREYIEQNKIDAPVVLWGDDEVDIYIMQIQGSAVAHLDDGTDVRLRYDGNNGHPFVGIGSILLKKGLIEKGQSSMEQISDFLKNNKELADVNMQENPRFIFHKLSDLDGPVGAMGVTLTAGRSLATDTKYIPLGSFLWLETTGPEGKIEKFVLAQDIGSAIKGPVRGDYFWGYGKKALASAGKMNAVGRYYILLPRE